MMWDNINCRQIIDFNHSMDNQSGDSFFDASHKSEDFVTGGGQRRSLRSPKSFVEASQESLVRDTDGRELDEEPQGSPQDVYCTPLSVTIDSIDSHFSPRHQSSPISNQHLLQLARKNGPSKKPLPPKSRFMNIINRLTKNTKAREAEPPNDPKDFWATLRHNSPLKPLPADRVTKPVPFKLSQNKRKLENIENYQPMAEQVLNFQCGIKKAKLENGTAFKIPNKPTVPKTPRLLTKARVRQRKVQEEAEPTAQYQFKARPVDPRVYRKFVGLPGVNQIRPRPITKPITPHLATKIRYQQRRHTTAGLKDMEPFRFRAQPVAPGVLGNESTVVQSRYMSFGKKRRTAQHALEEPIQEAPHFKAAPMPDFSKTKLPAKPPIEMAITQPEPFTFDEADRQRWAKRNARLAEQVEEQARVKPFMANPLPDFSRIGLPKKPEMTLTSPHPFSFCTDARIKPKQKEEHKEEKPRSIFPPISLGELHTEMRAKQRAERQLEKESQQWEVQLQEQEKAKEREQEELKALVEYRKTLVHRAKPVPSKH